MSPKYCQFGFFFNSVIKAAIHSKQVIICLSFLECEGLAIIAYKNGLSEMEL